MSTTFSPRPAVGDSPADRSRSRVRADIQALRAVAVSLVVVYHLVPDRLTGGFVGVDVFFVVSGFLITSHLLGRPPTGLRDLLTFWARRARRLLPASLLVLVVSLVAAWLVLPDTRWEGTARQASAASLYVVNWLLADDAVDYLAAEAAASPVQHFWSLSVEEQFYLGWPVLVLLLGWVAARWCRRVPAWQVYTVGLGAVAVASLAWSVHLTAADPARAYFVTPTRIWELAAGGLLAAVSLGIPGGVAARMAPGVRAALAWTGLALIVVVAATYDSGTPFPGWQAALPVLATVAVIAAEAGPQRWSPTSVLGGRAVQWLGDVSYSVYLWHWPLIVLVPVAVGVGHGVVDEVAILAATLLLAGVTKRHVEDRFRRPPARGRLAPTYAAAAAGMAVTVALAAGTVAVVEDRQADAQARVDLALSGDDPCFGAGALRPGQRCPEPTGEPIPAPALAAEDKSEAYGSVSGRRDCWSSSPAFRTVTCELGDPAARTDVALVGNSHAGHWLPALQELAEDRGWRITTYLASQCAMSAVRQQFRTADHSTACERWVDRTSARVVEQAPDLVVLSNRTSVAAEGQAFVDSGDDYRTGYDTVLDRWADAGLSVAVLRDTPAPGDGGVIESVPDCVAEHLDDLDECSGPRADWEPVDPAVAAARDGRRPGVSVVDLNDLVCEPDRCASVVGGAVVYFDASHLTATYARTLAPFLERPLLRALGRR